MMLAEEVTLWAVHEAGNERHSGPPRWFYINKELADANAAGNGWYGGTAQVSQVPALKLLDEPKGFIAYYLLAQPGVVEVNQPIVPLEKVREIALAKLTSIERMALGI